MFLLLLFFNLANNALPFLRIFFGVALNEPCGVPGKPRIGEPIAERVGERLPALDLSA